MRSAPDDVPSDGAVPLTVRISGALVQVRVYGLVPTGRTGRTVLVVLAVSGDPDVVGAAVLCRRLGASGQVAVLHHCRADADGEARVRSVVEWVADHAEPLGGRRGEVQLGAAGAATRTAQHVTARIDGAGWPTVIRPLVTARPTTRPAHRGASQSRPSTDHREGAP